MNSVCRSAPSARVRFPLQFKAIVLTCRSEFLTTFADGSSTTDYSTLGAGE
jgi:hypothetical protein